MCADVGLFTRVGADVTGLMFQTIKGPRTEWTLVRSRDLRFIDRVIAGSERNRFRAWICHVSGSRLGHCVRSSAIEKGAGALKDGKRHDEDAGVDEKERDAATRERDSTLVREGCVLDYFMCVRTTVYGGQTKIGKGLFVVVEL